MDARLFGIVPAAGSSSRMRASISKVLLPVGDETVISRSIRILLESVAFEHIVVAASMDDIETLRQELSRFQKRVSVTVGGTNRQQSVAKGISELALLGVKDADLILTHDAARCFIDTSTVIRCVEAARFHGAVTAAVPCVDTLIRADDSGNVGAFVDRSEVWSVQTPQVFRYDLLARAHDTTVADATDDASLVTPFHAVKIVLGARENFKLTTPDDYKLAQRLAVGG